MSDVARSFPTTTHVFVLAPMAAAEAFDLMLHDPAMAPILTPAGPISYYPMQGYRPLRAVPAALRLPDRRNRTLEVILELLPWSESRSELAIWSKSRPGILAERSVAAYLQAAHRSLETLASLLDTELVASEAHRQAQALPEARNRRRAVAARE